VLEKGDEEWGMDIEMDFIAPQPGTQQLTLNLVLQSDIVGPGIAGVLRNPSNGVEGEEVDRGTLGWIGDHLAPSDGIDNGQRAGQNDEADPLPVESAHLRILSEDALPRASQLADKV
jgi:hypothetical protein